MREILSYLHELNIVSLTFRLLLAMLSGGMIGLERGTKRRPAGCRTYMLVCLGAALTMMLSQYEYYMLTTRWANLSADIGIKTDVSRFGAQVINGIGFLGSGTILVTGRQKVKGLTTAAGLWASACVGLAVGAGFYEGVFLAFILIFLCMRIFPVVENYVQAKATIMNLYVEFESLDNIGAILARIKSNDVTILDVDIERGREKRSQNPSAVFSLHLNQKRQSHAHIISSLSDLECIFTIDEM